MDNRRTTKGTTERTTKWTPPRGLLYFFTPDRPSPFGLRWRLPNGQKKALSFETEAEREKIAKKMAEERENSGKAILTFDADTARTWAEFARISGGADPIRMFYEWQDATKAKNAEPLTSLTVTEAWTKYRALRQAEERLSFDSWRHIDKHIGERFVGAFGHLPLHKLTTEAIRDWLQNLKSDKTNEPVVAQTVKDHRKNLKAFLNRCVREKWLAYNPVEQIAIPYIEPTDVTVATVKDAFHFFKANRNEPVAARIAMIAFGGVRDSAAAGLAKANLNFDEKGITIPANLSKNGKREHREGHPDNLWAWLKAAPDTTWKLTDRQFAQQKLLANYRAQYKPDRNIWRHSFASYLLAETRNYDLVGHLMQHGSYATTKIYEGVATKKNAQLYFAITPESVLLTWEEFEARFGAVKATVAA